MHDCYLYVPGQAQNVPKGPSQDHGVCVRIFEVLVDAHERAFDLRHRFAVDLGTVKKYVRHIISTEPYGSELQAVSSVYFRPSITGWERVP